jgi:hypothetical protein
MKKIMYCFGFIMLLGLPMFAILGTMMLRMGFVFDGVLIYGCALTAFYCSYLMFNIAIAMDEK